MPINFNDAQVARGFLMPSFFNVEAAVVPKRYPSFRYDQVLPVITEGNEWARGTTFRSSDAAGKAEFLNGKGFDMPYADVSVTQYQKGFELAGIGYEWTLEEMQVAAMEGRNLSTEKGDAAHKIAEAMLWSIAMTGDAQKGWTGITNDPNVTKAAAPQVGSGTGAAKAEWRNKTPDQILADLNAMITGVFTVTQEIEMPDTILLPTSAWMLASTTPRSGNSDTTILQYLLANNPYTAETGRPLTVRGVRALNTAGDGNTGRAVAYNYDPDVVRFHLPMPHKFLPPWQKGSMTWEVAGIMRTGGVEVRRPGAITYLDGITAP